MRLTISSTPTLSSEMGMADGEEADGGGVRVGDEKVARRAVSRA